MGRRERPNTSCKNEGARGERDIQGSSCSRADSHDGCQSAKNQDSPTCGRCRLAIFLRRPKASHSAMVDSTHRSSRHCGLEVVQSVSEEYRAIPVDSTIDARRGTSRMVLFIFTSRFLHRSRAHPRTAQRLDSRGLDKMGNLGATKLLLDPLVDTSHDCGACIPDCYRVRCRVFATQACVGPRDAPIHAELWSSRRRSFFARPGRCRGCSIRRHALLRSVDTASVGSVGRTMVRGERRPHRALLIQDSGVSKARCTA